MKDNIKYNIGDIVVLKTDSEQKVRIVTGILIRKSCNLYYLTNCTEETLHYDFEISTDVNEIFKLMNQ